MTHDSYPCFWGQQSGDMDPRYFGREVTPEQIEQLQFLLAAERAGLRVATESLADTQSQQERAIMERIRACEAESSRMLRSALEDLNVEPSARVGDFYQKAMAIETIPERFAYIDRGRDWVYRHLKETLAEYKDQKLQQVLQKVMALHRP